MINCQRSNALQLTINRIDNRQYLIDNRQSTIARPRLSKYIRMTLVLVLRQKVRKQKNSLKRHFTHYLTFLNCLLSFFFDNINMAIFTLILTHVQ